MKKRTIEYVEEPRERGWRFDPNGKHLSPEEQAQLGIPAAQPAGMGYDRTQEGGEVRVKARRGGKRAGAGRKPSGHVRLNLLVPAETKEKLRKLAEQEQVTMSEAFRRTLAAR